MAKQIVYGEHSRQAVLRGIKQLADAVKVRGMAVAEGAVATYVECPQCRSPKAVLADDQHPWKRSYFCPNCEHDWGIPRTPTMLEVKRAVGDFSI